MLSSISFSDVALMPDMTIVQEFILPVTWVAPHFLSASKYFFSCLWILFFVFCPLRQMITSQSYLSLKFFPIGQILRYSIISSSSVQFSSVAQSCLTLCDPMNHSTPGFPVHHQLQEFSETHIHQVSDAIQPSHSLSSPSPPGPSPSQHQSLFQWANSSHEVAKALECLLVTGA